MLKIFGRVPEHFHPIGAWRVKISPKQSVHSECEHLIFGQIASFQTASGAVSVTE